jgi:hypothetical protein
MALKLAWVSSTGRALKIGSLHLPQMGPSPRRLAGIELVVVQAGHTTLCVAFIDHPGAVRENSVHIQTLIYGLGVQE